jgi:acid stress chaperone HdeB
MIDMTRVTCSDYRALGPQESRVLSAWMSGWYNFRRGSVMVDLGQYADNIAKIRDWCGGNPTVTLMSAIEHVIVNR